MFKIELRNCDFRKSLYPYIVDAEKNGLRPGAGIISGRWKKYILYTGMQEAGK